MLESYITPLLMGYVNKYIKNLKPSDLSLSVWGGDVVLQNLELNLDVLQKELSLPVHFLSGRIHELQIHVPWTRITYEPVTITINTIEFVVKLRDPDDVEVESGNDDPDKSDAKEFKKEMQKAKAAREAEHLSPGYVQGVVNKVINNISICVNNLILKYVEDDIVFSLNVKSITLFSANENWEQAFVELALPSLCLRKICNISNLTICLDSRNADGKIEMYQDPILYKCNLSCRLLSKYMGLGSVSAYENQLNVYCESLDLSSTDVQLPMIIRLLKLCTGLYYRTLDLPGCKYKLHPAEEMMEKRRHLQHASESYSTESNETDGQLINSSWVSWAWSMVPNIQDGGNKPQTEFIFNEDSVLLFGIYITQCSLTLKITNEAHNSSIVGSKRFEFSPVLNIEMSGCAVEVISKGEEYFDCQFGVCNIVGYMIGDCLCKSRSSPTYNMHSNVSLDFDEPDREYEDELFFQVGCPKDTAHSGVGFLEDSLFRQPNTTIDNQSDASCYQKTVLPEKGKQFSEAKVTQKFGAFFIDYLYIMELPNESSGDLDDSGAGVDNSKGTDLIKEVSSKRIIVGAINLFITSRLCHLIAKIQDFCQDDAPERKMKSGIFIDNFVMNQLKLGNFSTRGLHVTFSAIKASIIYPDHVAGKADGRSGNSDLDEQDVLCGILLQVDRADYQATSPMFPNELNALLQADSNARPILYRAAYADYFVKFFGVQLGVCQYRHEFSEPVVLNVIPPIHASAYAKVFIGKSSVGENGKFEFRINIPTFTISLTKAQLMMIIELAKSWTHDNPRSLNQFLVDDVFSPKAEKSNSSSILQTSIIGIDLKYIQTDFIHAMCGSIGSIKASQQSLVKGVPFEKALMYGPMNTSKLSSVSSFLDETRVDADEIPNGPLLSFTIQMPLEAFSKHSANVCSVARIDLKGIAAVFDADLLKWVEYQPSTVPRKRHRATEKRISRVLSRSFSASTPRKQKSYARILGNSPSKTSKEQKFTKQDSELAATSTNTRESRLSVAMAILKSIILKIDIQTSVVFFPVESMSYGSNVTCPEYRIPFAFRKAFIGHSPDSPNTLVVALPNVSVCSSNCKIADLSGDIPINNTGDVHKDNSLPWTLSGDGLSIYVLSPNAMHANQEVDRYHIWFPAPWTMLLAAADADPKTPDDPRSPLPLLQGSMTRLGVNTFADTLPFEASNLDINYQPSLGFCVHIDLTSVKIGISKIQAEVVIQLLSRFMKTLDIITTKNVNEASSQQVKNIRNLTEAVSVQNVALNGEVDRRSVSSTSTVDNQDGISISTEASIFSGEAEMKAIENVKVSLWLQWIIPKVSLTFYDEPGNMRPWYRIPCEIEDISLAFDYQQGEIRMKSKVGSIVVKNSFIRPGSNEWEFDQFDGVLLSSDDVLAHSVKTLPMLQKSSPRAFLTLNYTRQPLLNDSLRKRYTSLRSEAIIPPENAEQPSCPNERVVKYSIIDSDIYQHKLEVIIQSFDILFAIKPILSVVDGFLVLSNPFVTKTGRIVKAAVSDETESTREGRFQPLPILDLDSKGFRIIVPLLDDVKNSESDFEENTVIFFVHSLLIKSDPLNRISSTILHKDWYRQLRKHQRERNRRTKLWHVQYQMDLNCMSLWSGKWGDISAKNQRGNEKELAVNAEGQNPALEWNYQVPTESQPIKLRPLLQDFNCRSTLCPALKILKNDMRVPLTISASSMEVNFSKDIVAFCNPFQVNLLMKIANQTMVSLQNIGLDRAMTDSSMVNQVLKSPDIIDSGISSVMSLKGTSDLKSSPEPDVHFTEKTPEMHSMSSFEFFISGSKVSLSLYVPEVSIGPEYYEDNQIYKLVGYTDIIQPTLDIRDNIFKITVYDALIALPGNNKSSNTLPDRSLFDDMVLGTLKGKQNEKTGLFASALSIKATTEDKVKVIVNVDRPLLVNFALTMTAVFDLFASKLITASSDQLSVPKSVPDSNHAEMSSALDEIAVQTCRINVTFLGRDNSHVYRLLTALRSMNILLTVKHQGQFGEYDAFNCKCDVDGFEINLSRDHNLCRLLSPCIFGIEGESQTIRSLKETDRRHIQKMIVFINSGLVHVQVGPLHLEYLTSIMESVGESLSMRSNPKGSCDVVVHEGTNNHQQMNIIEYSADDLTTGPFDYVVHSGEDTGHPLANQIVFSEEDSDRPPCMTWRYPVPRFLNEITVMPLPFHVDEVMPGDDLAEIPCVIRYWDHIEQTYVTYRHFFLSQSRSQTISLPNPLLDVEGTCQVASEEWQVVVDVALECESEKSEAGSIPDDILREVSSVYKTPVSATSLAACIKINSCYIPEKIPRFMCSVSIGCVQLILSNHFNTSENVQPRLFAPFFLDSFTYPSNQEAFCLELRSFLCKGSLSGSSNSVKNVITEFDASLDVMNYKDLSWRKCLDIASFAAEISLPSKKHVGTENLDLTQSRLNMAFDSVKLIASQCIIHTLSLTIDNWKRGLEIDMDIPLLNHYIICNETEDVLRFGQVDTDEDILLASGQMYPYSWRSSHNRMMHLCVDSIGDWRWSAPFDIDSDRGCTRSIKHSTHSSLVHVEIRKTGGLQKQIIFRGGLFFRNCLKTDVSFEVFLHHVTLMGHLNQQKVTQVPKSFIVPAEATRPSMSFAPDTVTSVYLRLISDTSQGPWSSAINVTIEEDLCVPLTLTIKDDDCNVWFTVTRIYNEQFSHLQICICPFFIVRNHLPWPVVMTATSRDKGQSSYLMSQGRGHETEVLNLANDVWYSVNFQLEGTKECTDPPIPINTTFLDILKKKRKLDLQNVDYSTEWPYKDGCSIPEEQPPDIIPNRGPKQGPETPTPDLHCQLLQRWEYLPTIGIEIKPKFILNNQSELNLFVRDAETHLIWGIERSAVVTSPAFQTSIQFGRVFEGSSEMEWSSQIYLSESKKSPQSYSQDSLCLYQHSSISFSIFNPTRNRCLQFTLTSKIRRDMIIISIRERFCLYNSTGLRLRCFPILCEDEELPIQGKDIVEIGESDEPHNISEIALIRKADADNKKEPDLSKFSIRFFFYDSGSSPGLLSDDHVFDLSRDHLRENVILRKWDEEPICVAMTSYMKDGVINIFLDKESYPSILFNNKTDIVFRASVLFNEKENEHKSKRADDEDTWESEIEIGSKQRFCYQCKSFRDSFPKTGNLLHGRLKLETCAKDEATASKLLLLHDEDKTEELLAGTDKILISVQKVANCFYVLINSEIPDYSLGRRPMNLPVVYCTINRVDVIVIDDVLCEEVFDLCMDKLIVQHNVSTGETCLGNSKESRISIKIGALQVDNQSTDDYDHFPVVVLPLREVSQRYRGDSPHNAPFGDTHASVTNSLFETVITTYKSHHCGSFIDDVKIKAEPLEVYTEDTFIYRLISLTESFAPPPQTSQRQNHDIREAVVKSVGRQILYPINIGTIEVEDIKILLSIHASLKMYLSADHMPVVLGKFMCHPTRTIQKELTRKVLYHYLTQALVRAGLMLGSLEILANPTGLIRSVGQGIADFFSLPYDGLTRGPSAFVSGIGSGIGSFFRHASVGALTSMTNFASSLSRNMDRLSLDEQHMIRQEEQRCRTSSQVWPGFSSALSGFGISLLGAVAGIVDHPITNIQNAETTRDAVKGAARGLGKGLVGIVAKPIGGAMELVSQTGQGILVGTGLTKLPQKLRSALDRTDILKLDKESYMKYFWKVIRVEFEEYANLFVITDVNIRFASEQNGYDGAIILTPSALYLYELNNIRMAFACNEVTLRVDQSTTYQIHLEKICKHRKREYCFDQMTDIKADDVQYNRESDRDSIISQSPTVDISDPIVLQMHPTYVKLLLSQFCHQKDLSDERVTDQAVEVASFN